MTNDHSKMPTTLKDLPVKNSKHQAEADTLSKKSVEVGGPKGPEPTRYGDWEKAGRCTDF